MTRTTPTRTDNPFTSAFEALERRLVLAFDPSTVPSTGELENVENPVALIETSLGNVYVELFVNDSPTFTANFINYLESGRWADSLFHRRSQVSTSGLAVLQGGGFHFTDEDGLTTVQAFDAVPDEANPVRAHDERTLSFAKAGPNTATSQWFINLEDNSDLQFLVDQRFTVFGRVADDASWAIVEAIADLDIENLTSDPNISPSPSAGAFGDTPVRGSYNSTTGFTEDNGVYVVAVTMAKAQGAENFFEHRLVYPGGYRGPGILTDVELGNANNFEVVYQVIIRYQNVVDRDQTIMTGEIGANTHDTFRLFNTNGNAQFDVLPMTPYSIEVWSTPRDSGGIGDAVSTPDNTEFIPLVGAIKHTDYAGRVSEQFIDASNLSEDQQQWILPRIEIDDTNRETFVTFLNLSDTNTTVTVQIYGNAGTIRTVTRPLDAYRRGGIQMSRFDIPDGVYGVRVSADQPIAAVATTFETDGGIKPPTGTTRRAHAAVGTAGNGATRAFTSAAEIPSNGVAYLDILQDTATVGSVVTLTAFFNDGSSVESGVVTVLSPSGGHRQINLRDAFTETEVASDVRFTLRVNASTAVASQTTIIYDALDEAVAAALPTEIGTGAYFSNGFLPGGGGPNADDVIAIYNPFAASAGVTFRYQLEFGFTDGTTVTTGLQTLASLGRANISVSGSALLGDVRAKIAQNPNQFQRYTITVLAFDTSTPTPTGVPVLAQLVRLGSASQPALSNPAYFAGVVPFTSGQFN